MSDRLTVTGEQLVASATSELQRRWKVAERAIEKATDEKNEGTRRKAAAAVEELVSYAQRLRIEADALAEVLDEIEEYAGDDEGLLEELGWMVDSSDVPVDFERAVELLDSAGSAIKGLRRDVEQEGA